MIEDVYTYLAADTTLAALIGGSGTARIYPDVSDENATPAYIVYSINADGEREEVLADISINLSIYAQTRTAVNEIKKRLDIILDKQDQISIPSDDYNIYWAKKISGYSTYEKETKLFHRAMIFAFKFKRNY